MTNDQVATITKLNITDGDILHFHYEDIKPQQYEHIQKSIQAVQEMVGTSCKILVTHGNCILDILDEKQLDELGLRKK